MGKSVISFDQKLSINDDRDYWITSDLHFYHKGVLNFCPTTRPYKDVDEMNDKLIEDWNSKVKDDDVIFHLGDFSFRAKEATQGIINQLNGNVVWIRGNHCYKVFSQLSLPTYDYLQVRFDGTKVCMMHYPVSCWNQQGRGSVMLHGHSHGSLHTKGRILDVGWDSVGEIISLKEAVDICLKKEVYCPDHHTKVEK